VSTLVVEPAVKAAPEVAAAVRTDVVTGDLAFNLYRCAAVVAKRHVDGLKI